MRGWLYGHMGCKLILELPAVPIVGLGQRWALGALSIKPTFSLWLLHPP
jgi:hypothetical protein